MMDAELQKELDAIPQHIKDTFIPKIAAQFDVFGKLSQDFEAAANVGKDVETDPDLKAASDSFMQGMRDLLQEFKNAGGTMDQWNILAPAIHYGELKP